MNKLQLIMICGVLLASSLTWQLASKNKAAVAQDALSSITPVEHLSQSVN